MIIGIALFSCAFVSSVRSFPWITEETNTSSKFSDTDLSSSGLPIPYDNNDNLQNETNQFTEEEKEDLRIKNNLYIALEKGYNLSNEDKEKIEGIEKKEFFSNFELNKDFFVYVGVVLFIFIVALVMFKIKSSSSGDL